MLGDRCRLISTKTCVRGLCGDGGVYALQPDPAQLIRLGAGLSWHQQSLSCNVAAEPLESLSVPSPITSGSGFASSFSPCLHALIMVRLPFGGSIFLALSQNS